MTVVLLILQLHSAEASGGTSVALDGVNDYIAVGDAGILDGSSTLTWNIWVNQSSPTGNAVLFGKYLPTSGKRAYIVRLNGDKISLVLSGDGSSTSIETSSSDRRCGIRANGEWTMLTVTYNTSQIIYYHNGEKCDEDITSISRIHASPESLTIGGGYGGYFNGSIDEAHIYSRVLSASEVMSLYEGNTAAPAGETRIPVLTYHQIKSAADESDIVSPQQFSEHMEYLSQNDYTTITFVQYKGWREGKLSLPPKPVIISFDDGWSEVHTTAYPIMRNYGFRGTVNVITNYASGISGGSSYMHWEELQALKDARWDIQSHGVGHVDMLTLNESAFRDQLEQSHDLIYSNLGRYTSSFVFPFHSANSEYTRICGEYYDLCWTRGSDPENPSYATKSTPAHEYDSLRRITINNDTSLETFSSIFERLESQQGEVSTDRLELHIPFDEGSGSIAHDSSPNQNHGELRNGATW